MSHFIEKRRYPRVQTTLPLRYNELHGKSYSAKDTVTKNISEGGVRFQTDRFFSLACHLVVEISVPELFKPIRTISKVAWIKKLPSGTEYEIGGQFLAMTNEDEEQLAQYTKRALSSKF